MERSPNLNTARIRAIVGVIRRMAGSPTWKRIEREVGDFLGHFHTRQALQAHPAIKAAYLDRKRGTEAPGGGRPLSTRARAQLNRDQRQRERIAELEAAVDALNERVIILLHNGYMHGIAKALLEADLPVIDRAGSGLRLRADGHRRWRGRQAGSLGPIRCL